MSSAFGGSVRVMQVQEVDESVGLTGSKNGMLQSKVVADPSSPLVGTSSGKDLAKALCSEVRQLSQLYQEELNQCLDGFLRNFLQSNNAGIGASAASEECASNTTGFDSNEQQQPLIANVTSNGDQLGVGAARPFRARLGQPPMGQLGRDYSGASTGGGGSPLSARRKKQVSNSNAMAAVELPGSATPLDQNQTCEEIERTVTTDGNSPEADVGVMGRFASKQRFGLMSGPMSPTSSSKGDRYKSHKKKGKGRAADNLFKKTREKVLAQQTIWQRIAYSVAYEWLSGALIVANSVFLGWQSQLLAKNAKEDAYAGRDPGDGRNADIVIAEVSFAVLFTLELFIRWRADGLIVFVTSSASGTGWNIFDITIVGLSWLEIFLEALELAKRVPNISIFRILRVVRIVRVVRVIRVMRFFRELRMMVFSIINSVKSLVWVFLVLGLVFFVFGINFTVGTVAYLDTSQSWLDPRNEDLIEYFGSLDKSIMSLYQAMSGGNDWSVYYDSLEKLPAQYQISWIIYITFAIFAVVNIVTGVFVESALAANNTDRENLISEEMEFKKTYLETLKTIFEELDHDGTGNISGQEFEQAVQEERVMAYFRALKLDVSDAQALFKLLDYDQSEEISIDEFLDGCYRLQGESRTLDVKMMHFEVKFLKECMLNMLDFLREQYPGFEDADSG